VAEFAEDTQLAAQRQLTDYWVAELGIPKYPWRHVALLSGALGDYLGADLAVLVVTWGKQCSTPTGGSTLPSGSGSWPPPWTSTTTGSPIAGSAGLDPTLKQDDRRRLPCMDIIHIGVERHHSTDSC
jgi:hypothetical protein